VPLAPGPEVGLCRVAWGMAPLVAQDEVAVALMGGADGSVDPPHLPPIEDVAGRRIALGAGGRRGGVLAVVAHLSARFYSVEICGDSSHVRVPIVPCSAR